MNDAAPWRVRALQTADLGALMAIQRACYGAAYVEDEAIFARRLASAANCSLVLERAGQVHAYLAAYWSQADKITPLDGDFDASPAPTVLYLHDMAVHPAQAGQRLAKRLLGPLWAEALRRGMGQSCLVAVQGAQEYWARQGYRVRSLQDELQQQHLASYGRDAVYMHRPFGPGDALSVDADSGDNAGYA